MLEDAMKEWHRIVRERDGQGLEAILSDTVTFHSPVVHTPQEGKPVTLLYLQAALHVLNNEAFTYLREIADGTNAVLEFHTVIDGISINGVDMITWGPDGRIIDFKVMIRPLKAINMVHRKMGEMLEQLQ